MPKIVKAYSCEFSCGRRVTTKRKSMVWHESKCKFNPQLRACPTCTYERYTDGDKNQHYENQTGEFVGWYCEIDKLPENRMLKINCEFWEKK